MADPLSSSATGGNKGGPDVHIFINYRRDDTLIATGRIDDHLRRAFGEAAVYRDIASIPLASDFAEHIETAVRRCRAMVVVIGTHWVTPRLHDEHDFVRLEIEAALKYDIPVIPVLVDSLMPSPEQVPESLQPLLRRNGLRVDFGQDFSNHVARLIVGLRRIVENAQPTLARVAKEPIQLAAPPANRAESASPSASPPSDAADRSVTAPPVLVETSERPKSSRIAPVASVGLLLIAATIGLTIHSRARVCKQADTVDCAVQCDKKNAASCVNLGLSYAAGVGVTKDAARAAALYEQGCDGGDARGCSKLALRYAEGIEVPVDSTRAAALYSKGCAAGDSHACAELGSMYENGTGVAKDAKQAAVFYERGCHGGDALACNNLGLAYETGRGVAPDSVRAVALYEQACDGHNPLGCRNLGVMCEDGTGVSKDAPRAVALYRRSCDGGEARGCRDLGMMYDTGTGTVQNAALAVTSYTRGCDGGDGPACEHLASACANGIGTPLDRARALSLFKKACDAGYESACRSQRELSTSTNPRLP